MICYDVSTPPVHPCSSYAPLLSSSQSLKMVSRCQLVLAVFYFSKFYLFVDRQPRFHQSCGNASLVLILPQ